MSGGSGVAHDFTGFDFGPTEKNDWQVDVFRSWSLESAWDSCQKESLVVHHHLAIMLVVAMVGERLSHREALRTNAAFVGFDRVGDGRGRRLRSDLNSGLRSGCRRGRWLDLEQGSVPLNVNCATRQ